jgi:hypothetical protein
MRVPTGGPARSGLPASARLRIRRRRPSRDADPAHPDAGDCPRRCLAPVRSCVHLASRCRSPPASCRYRQEEELVAPVACRRSSAALPLLVQRARWLVPRGDRSRSLRLPLRSPRECAVARPEVTPGGRSSNPTSGRSLLKVAPLPGAWGTGPATPSRRCAPVRSDPAPRWSARTGRASSVSSRHVAFFRGTRSPKTRRTERTAIVAAARSGCARGREVVILGRSLDPGQVAQRFILTAPWPAP